MAVMSSPCGQRVLQVWHEAHNQGVWEPRAISLLPQLQGAHDLVGLPVEVIRRPDIRWCT